MSSRIIVRSVCEHGLRKTETFVSFASCLPTMHHQHWHAGKCQVIVTDGLTLGHPCCAIPHCQEDLQSNRHRFCKTHFAEHNFCAVIDCHKPIVQGSRMCANPDHAKIEVLKKEKNKAAFQLKSSPLRTQISHPNDLLLNSPVDVETVDAGQEVEEWFEVQDGSVELFSAPYQGFTGVHDNLANTDICPTKSLDGNGKKLKTWLSWRRTHNEQTIIRPD
jgi:hypothetical protein